MILYRRYSLVSSKNLPFFVFLNKSYQWDAELYRLNWQWVHFLHIFCDICNPVVRPNLFQLFQVYKYFYYFTQNIFFMPEYLLFFSYKILQFFSNTTVNSINSIFVAWTQKIWTILNRKIFVLTKQFSFFIKIFIAPIAITLQILLKFVQAEINYKISNNIFICYEVYRLHPICYCLHLINQV